MRLVPSQGAAVIGSAAATTIGATAAAATTVAALGTAVSLGGALAAVGLAPRVGRAPGAGLLRRAAARARQEMAGPGAELADLFDPRPERHRRHVHLDTRQGPDRSVWTEVRGLDGRSAAELVEKLQSSLTETAGVRWWQINASAGRLTAGWAGDSYSVEELLDVVEQVEDGCGTSEQGWSRHTCLPADPELLSAARLALGVDLLGLALTVWTRPVPRVPALRLPNALVAGMDSHPRLRRLVEGRLGPARADLLLGTSKAATQVLAGDLAGLLVDAGQRACAVAEFTAARACWARWIDGLDPSDGGTVIERLAEQPRPCPLPAGPVESLADRVGVASLAGTAASVLAGRGAQGAADALLAGIPKAARVARECFAAGLSARLARQGVLTLDCGTWRRLDRVTTVVVDTEVLRGAAPMVVDATPTAPGWDTADVWSAGQRLISGPDRSAAQGWRDVVRDGAPVGRILVGREPALRADALLAAARRAGLRVVLAGQLTADELRARAAEELPPGTSISAAVHRLQAAGHGVAVISSAAHRALGAADVGIGLAPLDGSPQIPWTADVVCPDLATVEQIVAATTAARRVSERGRTLAVSASALAGLLVLAGTRRSGWRRALGPVNAAGLMGIVTGLQGARRAARPPAQVQVPLLPWHALEPDEVRRRLGPQAAAPNGPASACPAAPSVTHIRGDRTGSDAPAAQSWVARVGVARPVPPVARRVVRDAGWWLVHLREELSDPLTPVLTVGAAASAVLGAPTDAVLVGAVMGVNAVVATAQRRRAERAMQELRKQATVSARVLTSTGDSSTGNPSTGNPSNGNLRGLPHASTALDGYGGPDESEDPAHLLAAIDDAAAEAVLVAADRLRVGDLIGLRAGEVVPADARLITVDGLELDESGLTGESITVGKQVAATPGAPVAERACMVFEGTVVVAGSGTAVVVAVGAATQAGRAMAAVPAGVGAGGVQAQLRSLTDRALPLTLGGGALVTALGLLRARPLRAAVADGVAVAVAAVPEGLPLVATVAQAAAALRLSRRGVLVRSSRAVEALGRIDTICFDKTGTLTEGVPELVELADLQRHWSADSTPDTPAARELLRAAARACPAGDDGPVLHATDRAVLAAARNLPGPAQAWDPVDELPFQSNRGYAAALGQTDSELRLIVKGAPEVLLARCTRVCILDSEPGAPTDPFTDADRDAALRTVQRLAAGGLRVLVVTRRDLDARPVDLETAVESLTLLGFLGLADTARPATRPVLRELARNGIDVRMVTGDHPVTARAVAQQLGITGTVVTGAQLDALDETARTELIANSTVFARVSPEHKVRIVAALQRTGRVVGMAGDGSNDAAAIRLADVGIGLRAHGSAAARDSADLVLTEPDLTLLLEAMVEGRRMWQQVRDAVGILIGGNAGEVAFTILGTAWAGHAPVSARQFLLVNLLTDMFPAMAVAVSHPRGRPTGTAGFHLDEAAGLGEELQGAPAPDLGPQLRKAIVVRGAATASGALGAWWTGRVTGPPRRAATMGLVALVGTQLGQTLIVGRRSPLVWTTVVGSGVALVAIVQTPGVSHFFGCTPLDPAAWAAVVATATTATAASVIAPRIMVRLGGSVGLGQCLADLLQIPVVGMDQQMAHGQQGGDRRLDQLGEDEAAQHQVVDEVGTVGRGPMR
ncbi:MAG TPA: cation-translocating P-type ATPase [Sporichthyaceae bacterium]|nr:cation-translocating P-type ATPase [Sporichthyaceae bacterium]